MNSARAISRGIQADPERVWNAMTDPDLVSEWMMEQPWSDSNPGSSITWSGEYDGRTFEDRGEIVDIDHTKRLVHTHFSPMSGAEDVPENYHQVEWSLVDRGDSTDLTLKMPIDSDVQAEEFKSNWETMLDALKEVAER